MIDEEEEVKVSTAIPETKNNSKEGRLNKKQVQPFNYEPLIKAVKDGE